MILKLYTSSQARPNRLLFIPPYTEPGRSTLTVSSGDWVSNGFLRFHLEGLRFNRVLILYPSSTWKTGVP